MNYIFIRRKLLKRSCTGSAKTSYEMRVWNVRGAWLPACLYLSVCLSVCTFALSYSPALAVFTCLLRALSIDKTRKSNKFLLQSLHIWNIMQREVIKKITFVNAKICCFNGIVWREIVALHGEYIVNRYITKNYKRLVITFVGHWLIKNVLISDVKFKLFHTPIENTLYRICEKGVCTVYWPRKKLIKWIKVCLWLLIGS